MAIPLVYTSVTNGGPRDLAVALVFVVPAAMVGEGVDILEVEGW